MFPRNAAHTDGMAIDANGPRLAYRPPSTTSSSNQSSSTGTDVSHTYDYTSGMDEAIKRGDELSGLAAQKKSLMYSGDIGNLMAAADRIRALKNYLSAYGDVTEDRPFPFAMPMQRLANVRVSRSSNTGTNTGSNTNSGGFTLQAGDVQ